MGSKHTLAVAVVVALAVALGAGLAVGDDSSQNVATVDSDHGLATDAAIADYRSGGVTTGSVDGYDADLTVATSKDDVGVDDQALPIDARNDYLRIQYHEDFDRTLRIHVPKEYVGGYGIEGAPYTQSGVESVTSDHHADFESVRGGEYLEVTVYVDEPADIVLPIQRDSAMSYRAVEWADTRVEMVAGFKVFSDEEWKHIGGTELGNDTTMELEGDPEKMVVQYDAHKQDTDDTWLNAPEGEADDVGVHIITTTSAGNETAYLVSTTEDPPDVRYKPDGTATDRATGWWNDAWQILDNVRESFDGAGERIPLTVVP